MSAADDSLLPPPPRENPDLVGHEAAERTLREAFDSGRMPHAWLIAGPRGIGKATLAWRAARYVLARGATTTAGAGAGDADLFGDAAAASQEPDHGLYLAPDHPVFRRVAAGGHADLLSVARSVHPKTGNMRSEIVVDDVRPLRDFLHLTPAEGGWRVAVIDCAEDMNRTAANALLKPLEEPPGNTLIILVSHAPGSVLPTIRSRCRRLELRPPDEGDLGRLLAGWWPDMEPAERRAVARLAEGSAGRALDLVSLDGAALYGRMIAVLAAGNRGNLAEMHGFCDALSGRRDEVVARWHLAGELLGWWLERAIRAAATGSLPTEATAGEAAVIGRFARALPGPRQLALRERVGGLFRQAERASLDRRAVMMDALLMVSPATG